MPRARWRGRFAAALQSADEELKQRLSEFAAFAVRLKGDEKSEAQPFLDHIFRALGHGGVIEAGATFEFRVAKKPGSAQLELLTGAGAAPAKGGKKFADLLWPSRVLIEMKSRTEWPKADAIIGNPPYLGSRYIAKEHGHDYAQRLYARFPGVPKMADFCTHWFRLAHDALPVGGRAGLVGTNTVRQNESREASLDYIVKGGGVITEAVSTQVWSGEAAVHVSIVNWVKGSAPASGGASTEEMGSAGFQPAAPGILAGRNERLDAPASERASRAGSGRDAGTSGLEARAPQQQTPRPHCRLHTQLGDSVDSPWKIEDLPLIPPTLKSDTDVTGARVLAANERAKKCFTGQNPVNAGFFLTHGEAAQLIKKNAKNREVIFPYMIGRDLVEDYALRCRSPRPIR